MGVDIVFCDNGYDQEKTVDCANLIVAQEADGVIFANWIAGTEELIAGIYIDAGLPCITWDGPHPGCRNFGPDNFHAAREAGRYLAGFAQEQGWDPAETELVVLWTAGVQVMGERRDGAIAGVLESFAIPEENIHVDIPHQALDDVFPLVTDWTTANPDAKNVLCFGHSDQPGVDCALALEQAGFLGRAAAASLGASDEALVDLRERARRGVRLQGHHLVLPRALRAVPGARRGGHARGPDRARPGHPGGGAGHAGRTSRSCIPASRFDSTVVCAPALARRGAHARSAVLLVGRP